MTTITEHSFGTMESDGEKSLQLWPLTDASSCVIDGCEDEKASKQASKDRKSTRLNSSHAR